MFIPTQSGQRTEQNAELNVIPLFCSRIEMELLPNIINVNSVAPAQLHACDKCNH